MVKHINQTSFDLLPALISLSEFATFSGLRRDEIMRLRREHKIRAWTEGRVRARYYKADLARIAGFELNNNGSH